MSDSYFSQTNPKEPEQILEFNSKYTKEYECHNDFLEIKEE